MISPTELRIGNYITFLECELKENIRHEIIKVDVIRQFDVSLAYKPIPLTPEILIKCGFIFPFEKDGEFTERSYHLKMYSLWEVTGNIPSYWQLKIGNNFTNTSIQFLHQLQNLYHALTGTELEINL